jgi:hypothetical protein
MENNMIEVSRADVSDWVLTRMRQDGKLPMLPDGETVGHEICFNVNKDTGEMTITVQALSRTDWDTKHSGPVGLAEMFAAFFDEASNSFQNAVRM